MKQSILPLPGVDGLLLPGVDGLLLPGVDGLLRWRSQ
jgi:hypothetical protein